MAGQWLVGRQVAPAQDRRTVVLDLIQQSSASVQRCLELVDDVVILGEQIAARLADGGKLLICGNGGSAADAQHFAGELVGRFLLERGPIPAIALTTDSSVLTAIANDYSYEQVFARQVQALAHPGDVLVGISTSGRSESVLAAFAKAPVGVLKVAITGTGGTLVDLADVALRCSGSTPAEIQAAHGVLIHALSAAIESSLD